MTSPEQRSRQQAQAKHNRAKRLRASRKRRLQRRSLTRVIKDIRHIFASSTALPSDVQQAEVDDSKPVKAVFVYIDEIPEEIHSLVEIGPDTYAELDCKLEALENLYFYLYFYHQVPNTVHPLPALLKSMISDGVGTVRLVAVQINLPDQASTNQILENLSSEDPIFSTTDPLEVYDLERLLFIDSSRELIFNGDIYCFKTASGLRALVRLLRLKKWLLEYFSEVDRERFILISSTVLFSFGIRVPNDIDLHVYRDINDHAFLKRLEVALEAMPQELSSCMDMLVRGPGRWSGGQWRDQKVKPELVQKWIFQYTYEWPNSFGAASMSEVIANPKFHHYFLGLKCISIRADIERRVRRSRPSAYADLFYMKCLRRISENYPITISRLTEYIYQREGKKWIPLLNKDHHKYFERIQKHLRIRYGVSMSIEDIEAEIVAGPYVEPYNYPFNST